MTYSRRVFQCVCIGAVVMLVAGFLYLSASVYANDSDLWSEEYDAAQGTLHNVSTEASHDGFSGDGYVAGWNSDGQRVDIEVDIPNDGYYTLTFRYSAAGGQATRYLEVSGASIVEQLRLPGTGSWSEWLTLDVYQVYLEQGSTTVSLDFDAERGSSNWLNYDSLTVTEAAEEELYEWGQKADQAEQAQHSLYEHFWNDDLRMFNNEYVCNDCNGQFHYWWQAHAIDTLIDGYERTNNDMYLDRAIDLYDGVVARNNGITNHFYDDMLWMGLALLRLHEHTNNPEHEQAVFTLWEDIQTGWNDHQGGGIAWNKSQLDYKNTPSNAPAVILAARLYETYGDEADLEWAEKIYEWQTDTLVDPQTGFVWDGINRTGDGSIDKNWEFTYNQGVYIGAALELNRLTDDERYLETAKQTAETAIDRLANHNGIIHEGGSNDGGLFKGIFIRYLTDLYRSEPAMEHIGLHILKNAESAWHQVESEDDIFFGASWLSSPAFPVHLSQQLSGVMLMEHAALVENELFGSTIITLRQQLEAAVENGDVRGPLIPITTNRLNIVDHQWSKGDFQRAVHHLENFHKHIHLESMQRHISAQAKAEITELVDLLLEPGI